MEFRPCIDIHDGRVKQIVGSTLSDNSSCKENFISDKDSAFYARLYKNRNLSGGHVIILNKFGTKEYEDSLSEARKAFEVYPGGLQVGGGIDSSNASRFIEYGASHVIVTGFLFDNGKLSYDKMDALRKAVGRERIVFDLSCKKVGDSYLVAYNRWQNVTNTEMNSDLLCSLEEYCDEFLIHAVDVEGKSNGPEENVVRELAKYKNMPVTYAGGIHSYEDIDLIKNLSDGRINVTIGSSLDIFGGNLSFEEICERVM